MLILKKEFKERIIAHSKRELPDEACGILAGPPSQLVQTGGDLLRRVDEARVVTKVYEMTNTEKSPQNFFMDAREQLKVTKEIRNLGLEMIGIYHSHVASQAYPSAHDIELAFYPEVSYVIVSLKDNPSVRSFKINPAPANREITVSEGGVKDKQISEEEVKIVDS